METYILTSHKPKLCSFITVCIILLLLRLNAFAVTLPFSDDFTGDTLHTNWQWVDKDNGSQTDHTTSGTDVLEVTAKGSDLWRALDEYAAVYLNDVSGNFTAIVQIKYQDDTHDMAKAGFMVRNNITGSFSNGYLITALTPGNGFLLEHDNDGSGTLDMSTPNGFAAPPDTWLKLQKSGTIFKGYYSTDGSAWTLIATVTIAEAALVQDLGLFVCSHKSTKRCVVEFDNFSIIGGSTMYTYYRDADGDTYGDPGNATSVASTTPPAGYTTNNTDCDDTDNTKYPGNSELCDGKDNNCNGSIDEAVASNTYYLDVDGDGYGIGTTTQEGCTIPSGYAVNSGDCDDDDANISPGEFDICGDSIDQDCSGDDLTCESGDSCLEIADIPLSTQIKAAAPMIMFLMDDSESMSWDVLCQEQSGKFSGSTSVINRADYWKAQYYDYNGIYYDPNKMYNPWALYSNADPDTPKVNPTGASTQNLASNFIILDSVSIPYAHYYDWSATESAPYLVIVSSPIKYYKVTGYTSTSKVTDLQLDGSPPADIKVSRTYANERQNFANWYSYYRTRELLTKASVGNVIADLKNFRVGIHTLNHSVVIPVQSVKIDGETDKTDYLISEMYKLSLTSGTPLSTALHEVGKYYDADDGNTGNIGPSPFALEDDGGACQHAFTIIITDSMYNGDPPGGNWDDDNNTAFDGGVFGNNFTTLADVSMHYYERDLSSALDNNVPISLKDSAEHQHMVTYAISFGVEGSFPVNDTCPEDPSTCPPWPNPSNDEQKVDELWHTAINGRGLFFTAADSNELLDAFGNLMTDIKDRVRTGASVTLNTQKLESDTDLYQGFFDSADWSGDLKAYDVDMVTGAVNPVESWAAKTQLDAADWNTGREILTYNGTSGSVFRYASLTTAQKQLMDPDPATSQLLVNYIRGDKAQERSNGGVFRNRNGKLGDIVSSSPVHDNGIVYIGANDGMMHAFDATNGNEVFAFVPNRVIENLSDYASPTYPHKYYVNGKIRVASVGSKRYLVGALGKGGRGYYGIDITDAKNITESAIPTIWEFPQTADNDMGFSYSEVSIVKSNYNGGEHVIIFGNGYDSPNGTAVLYILKLDGTLLRKINTTVGNPTTECNGLSTPLPVDLNYDSRVDYVYAGDLQGNMWKFDLSSTNKDNWNIPYSDGTDPKPLFQAKDKSGNPQAITGIPDAMIHCDTRFKGVIIVFGTGRYISFSDITDPKVQTIYGIYDWADAWKAIGVDPSDKFLGDIMTPSGTPAIRRLANTSSASYFSPVNKMTLLEQTQTVFAGGWRETTNNPIDWFDPVEYAALKVTSDEALYDKGLHVGWFFDLPIQGEKVISRTQIRDGKAIIVSIEPSSTPCTAGGSSVVHVMNACNGGELDTPQFDTNGDGKIDGKDDNKTGKVFDDDIYYAPAIIEDKMYFSKDKVEETLDEQSGLHYLRFFK